MEKNMIEVSSEDDLIKWVKAYPRKTFKYRIIYSTMPNVRYFDEEYMQKIVKKFGRGHWYEALIAESKAIVKPYGETKESYCILPDAEEYFEWLLKQDVKKKK
jgi:hypothetical protein